MATCILGLSALYHDAAAALVVDGRIEAAAQEERFTRVKGDPSFPRRAVAACLELAGLRMADVDHVVFYEDPVAKLGRILASHAVTAPRSLPAFLRAVPSWASRKLWMRRTIRRELGTRAPVHLCDHHVSHAASAFYPSPFERAAILTIDGVGEWSTASWGVGDGARVELRRELRFPHSLGLLYSAFTHHTGFKINSGEYKLMGLAPYGEPRFVELLRAQVVHVGDDGAITLNQRYFDYVGGVAMTNARFERLLGGPARAPEAPITAREMDLAASIQRIVDDVVMAMARHVHRETGQRALVMAGGVALNVVAIGKLAADGPFERVWVQPAAGDAGGALGAALWCWHDLLGQPRTPEPTDAMRGALLGPDLAPASPADDALLARLGATWEALDDAMLAERIAVCVADGKVVALARGRMELGPRALGARSILADARAPGMQRHLNLAIKFRESFRPFAPIVLAERAADYFAIAGDSPYMLRAVPVLERRRIAETAADRARFGIDRLNVPRSDIPAVTHVDYSARVQTVDAARHPFLHDVLRRFEARTGCAVMVNTSFNVRGEPIVLGAEDAYRCFLATDLDCLVVGNRFLERRAQANLPLDDAARARWLERFPRD